MTRNDFTFLDKGKRHLSHNHDLAAGTATYLTCIWRSQKNGDNGQEITFAGDRNNPKYCTVEAGLHVYHRSKCLV